MEALDASNKKASEELSRLIEEKKRREQEWPPEPPKWLKVVGGIGWICIGFRVIEWLQDVDWEKKSREEEEEEEDEDEDEEDEEDDEED
ncbi:hypothetical protein D6C86_05157 [Aureobasidium pullulans]|uniref:Uncharacterized protein n=1 Tax=Aureobasidium pullulans TaxID=5580 RepID=A0A4V4KV39_AURPU|nr:hypothetical protein D6C94_10265 [Aureobasidium pullulans]THZ36099.1 hypothetical protein D6C87_09387 [Aureobasidium pullulans]THZ60221.1 hypothetical protein D6C86_05157 [Aureobasidium pullulans]THZ61916.1 hypothetical protein D6C88_08662 [Aureobasidium pullulans]